VKTLSDAVIAHLRTLRGDPSFDGTRYQLVAELGRGGMGTVYRVRDRELDREVALKVVGEAALAGDAATRLAREARALARLEHPGIVPVHDAGVLPDGRAYYAMKLVRGERLDERLLRGLTLGEALRLFVPICDAVAFAHANGVIHRDLKPQNVMLGAFGEVLVLDWGLAKFRDEVRGQTSEVRERAARASDPVDRAPEGVGGSSTLDGTVIGTPGFMAPEQATGEIDSIDERTDVYSLGAILRSMATALSASPPRPLAAIVAAATATERASRYPDVATLSADLARLQDGYSVSVYRETILERARRIGRRHQTAITLILAYLVMRVTLLLSTGR